MRRVSASSAPAWVGWAVPVSLFVATALLYSGVTGHRYLFFDDDQYVTHNAVVRQGLSWAGLRWAFTTFSVSNWHPLTWLSHMLDVQLFGLDAGAHHLVGAALHALDAALLYLALQAMTRAPWRSAVVAALFAVHPLHVESVAWVSERKDVLSTLFGLLALLAWARFLARRTARRYAAVALLFAASLLAKPMWVTFPFVLLLLDVWPLGRAGILPSPRLHVDGSVDPVPAPRSRGAGEGEGRVPWNTLLLEKLPLAALSAASSVVTVVAQRRGGSLQPLARVDLADRVANAAIAYVRYLGKACWPAGLSPYYPLAPHADAGAALGAIALLAAVTVAAAVRLRASPWLAVGWCWFLGTLVPVIGLVQVGEQAMADRYTYLPLTGVFLAVTWEVAERARAAGAVARRLAAAAAVAAIAVLAAMTARQAALWQDQEILFSHAVRLDPSNARAHLVLAQALGARGEWRGAAGEASEAARLDPTNPRAHKNLGFFLYRLGRTDDAIAELERAVALDPGYAEAYGNLGVAYGRRGRTADALRAMARERELRSASGR